MPVTPAHVSYLILEIGRKDLNTILVPSVYRCGKTVDLAVQGEPVPLSKRLVRQV